MFFLKQNFEILSAYRCICLAYNLGMLCNFNIQDMNYDRIKLHGVVKSMTWDNGTGPLMCLTYDSMIITLK